MHKCKEPTLVGVDSSYYNGVKLRIQVKVLLEAA